jgi:hypothetical protein
MASQDTLIERTEENASERSGGRAMRAANLFDLRRIIGGVFVAWGVLLTVLGLTESNAEIDKAAGVNINLWAGLAMLVFGLLMLLWAFTRPLGDELREAEEGEDAHAGAAAPRGVDAAGLASHQRGGSPRFDRPGAERDRRPTRRE